jgi:hypothetical protein
MAQDLQQFVNTQNIARYEQRLYGEADAMRRQSLRGLLLDEENKFGSRSERLDLIGQRMRECKDRIARQTLVVERLNGQGHDPGPAQRLLSNMLDLHAVYEGYYQVILDGLDRSAL